MRSGLRFLLRLAAFVLVAGAAVAIFWQPKASVASANVLTKVNVGVQCSSVWDQWTHHAQPATLTLNGSSLSSLPAAQNSCASASHKIKEASAALAIGGVVLLGASFVFRRSPRV